MSRYPSPRQIIEAAAQLGLTLEPGCVYHRDTATADPVGVLAIRSRPELRQRESLDVPEVDVIRATGLPLTAILGLIHGFDGQEPQQRYAQRDGYHAGWRIGRNTRAMVEPGIFAKAE
jgi:hypothetical protein